MSTIAILLAAVLAGAGSPTEEPQFEHLAEGYTSTSGEAGIQAGYRMFSVPNPCPSLPHAEKLILIGPPPRLTLRKWFPYGRLVLIALDASGKLIPRVPILVEVELVHPPVLNLRNDMLAQPQVLPIRVGQFQFRVTTMCQEQPTTLEFQAHVTKPGG